jgi:2,3-bisphosphoglycerate-dependent phosphoglycerate mutase
MYGSLTGLSKAMVKQQYGEKQFKAWRRGYAVKPPRVSSFSPQYPGMSLFVDPAPTQNNHIHHSFFYFLLATRQ